MDEFPGEDKSKFNAAIATLKRIDEAKRLIMDSKLRGDDPAWYKCLGFIRSALNGKMKEPERIKADTFEELIEDSLHPKRDYNIVTPYYVPKTPQLDKRRLRYLLTRYEWYLVDIEEKKGMGLVDEDDDEGL